jgi:alkanesulfonate monooxygenase SsuD/methylene tetrahydromethanopterin reductase-like flavin-dependent oxidoreductase (luciferase family)
MTKPGILVAAQPGERRAAIEVAQVLDQQGFDHILCPYDWAVPEGDWVDSIAEVYDSVSLCTAILQATDQITVGTGISITYMRHPADLAGAASFNHEISGGRFRLGLGTGHEAILAPFGISWERPLGHMRTYVEGIRAAGRGQPLPPIWIAALRRKMTQLAGEIAEGTLGANVPLSHVPSLQQEIPAAKRDSFTFANIAPIWIDEDRAAGLAFVRRFLALHMSLPNYTGFFTEAGYGEEVQRAQAALTVGDQPAVEAAISERMAEDIGIFGSRTQMRDKIEAWQASGVTLTVSTLWASEHQPDAVARVAALLA